MDGRKGNSIMKTLLTALLITISSVASADIFVKYQGWVDESQMSDLWTKPSSIVYNMWYDNYYEYLIVNLRGTNYHYCGIPEDVVREWQFSSSLGTYYSRYIRTNYDCRYEGTIPPYAY